MSGRPGVIVAVFAFLGVALAAACPVFAFTGDAAWETCTGILACYCALMCVFVTVYVGR